MSLNNLDMEIQIHRWEKIHILLIRAQRGQRNTEMQVQEKVAATSIIHKWRSLKVHHWLCPNHRAHSIRSHLLLVKIRSSQQHISTHSHSDLTLLIEMQVVQGDILLAEILVVYKGSNNKNSLISISNLWDPNHLLVQLWVEEDLTAPWDRRLQGVEWLILLLVDHLLEQLQELEIFTLILAMINFLVKKTEQGLLSHRTLCRTMTISKKLIGLQLIQTHREWVVLRVWL